MKRLEVYLMIAILPFLLSVPLASGQVFAGSAIPEIGPAGSVGGGYRRGPTPEMSRSAGFADMVAKVRPAVVKVDVGQGHGTGFIVDRRGFVVSNYHVVQHLSPGDELSVELNPGRERLRAVLVAAEPLRDLSLILIDSPRRDWPEAGLDDRTPILGEPVVAMGYPLFLPFTVTHGIVSGIDRYSPIAQPKFYERLPREAPPMPRVGVAVTYLQTDAAVNPGNSGGPLFYADGGVAGVNTLIFSIQGGSDGLAWAISAGDVMAFLDARLRGRESEILDAQRERDAVSRSRPAQEPPFKSPQPRWQSD